MTRTLTIPFDGSAESYRCRDEAERALSRLTNHPRTQLVGQNTVPLVGTDARWTGVITLTSLPETGYARSVRLDGIERRAVGPVKTAS